MSTLMWKDVPTRTVDIGGVEFTYRELGAGSDVPVIFLHHFITQPVLVANGDHELMVDISHSADMARRLPNARLTIYRDSGHGGVFQHHEEFVPAALAFLKSSGETR